MKNAREARSYLKQWQEGKMTKSEIDILFGHEAAHGKWCTAQWIKWLGIDTKKEHPLVVENRELNAQNARLADRITELEEKLELCQLYPATA